MRAIVYHRYGPPEVLHLEEVEKPAPADDEVLVRVRTASANPLDWHFMRGEPRVMRLMTGFTKPRLPRLGVDAAGVVEAVGRNVTGFTPGDEVFGAFRGAFAEYACTRARALWKKPANVTFEQAASATVAGLTALQALRGNGRLRAGGEVLINGASGGVGTFAVQIAHCLGAEVTGVCSTRNVELVRSLGAHHVVDYTREDFTRRGERYDVVVDCVWSRSVAESRRLLAPSGRYVIVGAVPDRIGRAMLAGFASAGKVSMMLAKGSPPDRATLADLMRDGKVTPVIDRTYALAQVPEAIRYLEEGHARGKVVIEVAADG
ncbi:MAG TPA: NAD(P)-dependent alcohol dehydrogenase [Usitatibacter sp.]|nr:NAD(P)-dependent alcohol dehydrogenase [Usitatibacter sp.]